MGINITSLAVSESVVLLDICIVIILLLIFGEVEIRPAYQFKK